MTEPEVSAVAPVAVHLPVSATPGTQLTVNGVVLEWRQGWHLVLHARGWFTITGRGPVATISPDELPPGPPDGSDLLHQRVLIDDTLYAVVGVETCRVNHADPLKRCDLDYGLLVEPVTEGQPQ